MRSRRRTVNAVSFVAAFVIACTPDDQQPRDATVSVANEPSAITTGCMPQTFGLPCDPDGAGALTECQGVCWVYFSQYAPFTPYATCLPATQVAQSNEQKLCGNTSGTACSGAGVGKCVGSSCVPLTNPSDSDGHACRPSGDAHVCSGVCSSGSCTYAGGCPTGRNFMFYGQMLPTCHYRACDVLAPSVPSGCKNFKLAENTTCSDSNLCTVGENVPQYNLFSELCSADGECKSGPPKSCSDGNDCTADSCSPSMGCDFIPIATGPCNDGNACTAPDTCSYGMCVAGPALDCDDGDACTADSCNAANGCLHAPKNCDDNDACTSDSCSVPSGACLNTPIPNCPNDAGTDATTGGAGGSAGEGIAGAGGTAGANTGGAAGSATGGAAGSATGGSAGSGTGGAAGSTTGGAAGSTTGGAAGSTTGGAAGSTTGGEGGSATGGGAGSAMAGAGGSSGSASGGVDAGTGGARPDGGGGNDGCGCRLPVRSRSSEPWLLAVLFVAVLRRRHRAVHRRVHLDCPRSKDEPIDA